ncbi:MAG: ribonucleoside triphosphate reductase [Maricaulaceae bacterium]|nr:ribonucleoside triphosphate reductase [Maricaulaceae bacterium]
MPKDFAAQTAIDAAPAPRPVGEAVEVRHAIEEYLSRLDWRVQANANQGYSLGGLILNVSGKVTANYWLNHVYPAAIGRAHREGDIHIHDLDMLAGYCAGWSLRNLLTEGFNGVPGKIEAGPPKHFTSALGQIVNFLGALQNEWAGAQALSSFDTYMAPFVRADGLDYDGVFQAMQEFVFNLNVPSRWGTQTPFTNLTFDWVCPEDLREQTPLIGGREADFTYGELQAEMDLINRAFIEVMTRGDARGRVFTFPIPTYNITRDFPWDSDNAARLFDMTAKYGLPYFQNFINSDLSPGQIRSMCCRLQLDLRELLKRGNGLFGSAEQTGSIGVVTVNCARLGYRFKGDEAALTAELDRLLELGKQSLEIKRVAVQKLMDDGLYPYTRRYLGTLRNHFSTLGVNGLNEMIRNFTGGAQDITHPDGEAMALRLLDHVRARMLEFQEATGHMYNLEATPAEGTTYRFAKEDRKRFPGILQAGTGDAPYYTNSSQLPVGFTDDPFEALERQDALQTRYTGGTVLHLYMSERLSSADACKTLVRKALSNFRLPYITITPTFSICPKHGYLAGEHHYCPHCDEEAKAAGTFDEEARQPCEVWTRVMGYHRPVSAFNPGKKSEHFERRHFEEARSGLAVA